MPGTVPDARVAEAVEMLRSRVGERLQVDVPLAPRTTYRVGGPAAALVEVASVDDLHAIATARRATGVPVLVIGRGSNMLVADRGFQGVVVSIAELAGHIVVPDTAPVGTTAHDRVVTAGGGVALPMLARRTAAAGLVGFEWAVGVPGSIGGAVRMNAGGHGSDMAACLADVRVFDLEAPDAGLVTLPVERLGLRFRASSLPASQLVYEARLRLRTGDRSEAERQIADIVHWRRTHQPGGQNCGSVFVNPVPGEVTAGELIDGLGLRNLRIGTAHVSEKHANFIQAADGGSAADVRAVMEEVRRRVRDATGFRLRSEVRLVGFDDADPTSFEELP